MTPQIQFIKERRACPHNDKITSGEKTLSGSSRLIYDYAVLIDGERRGVFKSNVSSRGCDLFDAEGKNAITQNDNPHSWAHVVTAQSKDDMLPTVSKHLDKIPTLAQIAERKEREAREKAEREAAREAQEREERRIERLNKAAPSYHRIISALAGWLDEGAMPKPSSLMPDSETETFEQAIKAAIKAAAEEP